MATKRQLYCEPLPPCAAVFPSIFSTMSTPVPFQCELCETILSTRAFLERHKNNQSCRQKAARLSNQRSRKAAPIHTETTLSERLLKSFRSARTLRRIPKGARPTAASALLKVARECLQKNDAEAWCAFLTFPSTAFAQPDKATKGMHRQGQHISPSSNSDQTGEEGS